MDDATFANISTAFDSWLARCDRNPDNIGIFYFCGHGLEREDAYLLASDHGDSHARPWRNTIHFNATEQGVRAAARANTFCWLIDACRNNPIDTVKWPLIAAQPLFTPPIQQFPPRLTQVLRERQGTTWRTGRRAGASASSPPPDPLPGEPRRGQPPGGDEVAGDDRIAPLRDGGIDEADAPPRREPGEMRRGRIEQYPRPAHDAAHPAGRGRRPHHDHLSSRAGPRVRLPVGGTRGRPAPEPESRAGMLEAGTGGLVIRHPRPTSPIGNTRTTSCGTRLSRRRRSSAPWGAPDMFDRESEDGLLSLRYGDDPTESDDAAVPIDVIGEDFHEVASAPRLLELGKPVSLALRPGSYLVRAFLPSGEVVAHQARVGPRRETVVSIRPAKPAPHASLTWAYLLKRHSPKGGVRRRDRSPAGRRLRSAIAGGHTPEIEMILWSHGPSHRGRWQRVAAEVSLDDGSARDDPDAMAEASVRSPEGLSWLEVRGPGFPTRFVALAPSGTDRTRVLVVADDRSEPAFDPVDVLVSLGNRRAEASLSNLSIGALEQARRLGDSLVDRAEELLEQEGDGPVAATVAGYYLLKASTLDRPHDWTGYLAEGFTWLPDGPVIRAWYLLHRPDPDPAAIRGLLVEPPGGCRCSPRGCACSTTA